ncbi:nicotinate phosphoribosyltransferase [Amorphus coralli]|uniref:nicotinate phosphoribosyltransferase n=1 Tax=Amorphus coralli TaxID=340680 RepID=UPI000424E10E|nr:nicotinate phosphoribosyltransferase [Amorphus coralli]
MSLPPLGIPHDDAAIFTDLYQLSMLQSYHRQRMQGTAVFTLFFRKLPETRNFMLAAGLDPVLEYLETLHFSAESLDYLASTDRFSKGFLSWLKDFHFTGTVRAIPEGTPVFPHTPILEIEAPVAEGQLIETLLINQITVSTILASKAMRIVEAAQGTPVIDFGTRRAHGFDAGNKASRSAYIAGCASTANVLAGKLYGIPIAGTMAHSYVEAWKNELDAFRAFTELYPDTVLLIDTYDALQGAEHVIQLARERGDAFQVRAVRLDSGDLAELSKEVRRRFDAAGLDQVGIFVSGGLDEYRVADLQAAGAPISGYGVGTRLTTSSDAAELDMAYKLAAYDGEGRMKLSPLRKNLPGAKQVCRIEVDGTAEKDVVRRLEETGTGRLLMKTVMRDGMRTEDGRRSLDEIRATTVQEVGRLPARLRAITPAEPAYPVDVSDELTAYADAIEAELRAQTNN